MQLYLILPILIGTCLRDVTTYFIEDSFAMAKRAYGALNPS